jgi:hypothetical protein
LALLAKHWMPCHALLPSTLCTKQAGVSLCYEKVDVDTSSLNTKSLPVVLIAGAGVPSCCHIAMPPQQQIRIAHLRLCSRNRTCIDQQ